MKQPERYAEMCMILGDVVFTLRQNGYEISRENLIKVFANKRIGSYNQREAELFLEIIGKLSDA